MFSLCSDPTFEANFVLATLIDQPQSQYSQQGSRVKESRQAKNTKTKERYDDCVIAMKIEQRQLPKFGVETMIAGLSNLVIH